MLYYIIYIVCTSFIFSNESSFNTLWGRCTLVNKSSLSSNHIINTIEQEVQKMYEVYGPIPQNNFSILIHSVVTVILAIKSRAVRPVKYLVNSGSTNSTWPSRNMAFLGTMLLVFIIIHLRSFWYEMHFGDIGIDKWGNKDLHTVAVSAFKNIYYTAFYILSMIFLGFHLYHGVESAFQTLGLNTSKYEYYINFFGKTIAVIIPLIFATIPISIYVK